VTSHVSFDPLAEDAITLLSSSTGIQFDHIDFTGPQWLCVSARDDDGVVQGVLVGEFTTWFECHITIAIADRRVLRQSHKIMRAFFTAVYSRAVRCTAQCHPDNRAAIKGVRHMGFVYEGFMRKAIEGRWDALLFGMLKEECPWLPGYVPVERPDQGLRLTPSETLQ
jgi:hypothetical protein